MIRAPIEVAVFDLGGVLVDWDPRRLYAPLFEDPAELELFLTTCCTMAWHARHDAGVPMAENAAPLIAQHPQWREAILAWDARWDDMFAGAIDGTVALLEALDADGLRLFALTNLPKEKKTHILQTFPFAQRFEDMIVSGEEGVIKPNRRIYEIVERRIGAVRPSTIFFTDDRRENVEAALDAGWDAVLFTTPEALARDLAERGLVRGDVAVDF